MNMRRTFSLALALTALLALATGLATSGASTKFAYAEEVTATGDLIVHFEESSLKRFDGVDYQLDATATSLLGTCGEQQALMATFPTATTALSPDTKGQVTGTLTLVPDVPPVVPCQRLLRVEYTGVTLTNLATGHAYRLNPVSRAFP